MSSECTADIPANSRVIDLTRGPLPIGRASAKESDRSAKSSNLYIRNSHLSKAHARIWLENGSVFLEDVGSTFGTIWNNNLLVPQHPVEVFEGDTVGFVINRPSYVINTMFERALAAPMVLLDKLLNPRVLLQFVVHSIDPEGKTVVLLPVNDTAADASADLVNESPIDVENTPDVVAWVTRDTSCAENSDDEAPVEEKIVKEVLYADIDKTADIPDVDYVELLESGPEEHDNVLVAEIMVEGDQHHDNLSEEVESEDDEVEEIEEVENIAEVEQHEDSSFDVDEEEEDEDEDDEEADDNGTLHNVSIYYGKVHIMEPSFLDDEDDMSYDSIDESALDSELEGVNLDCDCGEVNNCHVAGVMSVYDEDYDSAEDDTFQVPYEDSDDFDSELDTPSSDCECDSKVRPNDKYMKHLTFDNTPCKWCTSERSSRKRTYDEAGLEDDVDVPVKPKRTKSVFRTVLKELAKGIFYATGTLVALAAYANHLDKRS